MSSNLFFLILLHIFNFCISISKGEIKEPSEEKKQFKGVENQGLNVCMRSAWDALFFEGINFLHTKLEEAFYIWSLHITFYRKALFHGPVAYLINSKISN